MEKERDIGMVIQKTGLIQKRELSIATIKLSEVLERGKRLEGSFFNIQGKRFREIIKKYSGEKKIIKSLIKKSLVPPPIKRTFTENKEIGTPYITPSELLEFNLEPKKYVIAEKMPKIEDWFVKDNWLILTQSGLVGIPILSDDSLKDFVISQNAIRLLFNSEEDAHLTYIFFKSKIGHKIVTTNIYGSVIQHIEPEHLEEITIPYPKKEVREEISQFVSKSKKLKLESLKLIKNAEKTLIEKIGFGNFLIDEKTTKTFIQKFSKMERRFESKYHDPTVEKIINILKQNKIKTNFIGEGDVSKKIILPGRFKRVYVKEGFGIPFLSSKEIMQFDPPEVKFLSMNIHKDRIKKELLLEEHMILISCSGTIGNVALVPKYWEKSSASQHVIRIVPSGKINPGYIYAWLNSSFGKLLIKRNSYGSVVDEIDDKQVASIPLPILQESLMDEIGDMVLQANKKRDEAWKLEKEAISMLEEEILK